MDDTSGHPQAAIVEPQSKTALGKINDAINSNSINLPADDSGHNTFFNTKGQPGGSPGLSPSRSSLLPIPPATLVPKPNPLLPRTTSDAAELERRKNEIVGEMLQRIRPFMGMAGQLRPDADFAAYATLMEGETNYVQRTLLLTVLLSTIQPEAYTAMGSSNRLLSVVADWVNEATKQDSPILVKLLDLLEKIPLSVDQLVEHRLGKTMKRLIGLGSIKQETRDKATALCDSWTRVARQEDAKRRNSDTTQTTKQPPITPRRVSEDAAKIAAVSTKDSAVANLSLFSENAVPPVKTRAAQILERVARGETSKETNAKPLSADDIHKAKRRQQYLQGLEKPTETEPEEYDNGSVKPLIVGAEDLPTLTATEPKPKRAKKRVSFADEVELVKIHYFDPPDDDYYFHSNSSGYGGGGGGGDRHDMDRNEASFAFKQVALSMEAECDWRIPGKNPFGKGFDTAVKSAESETQAQRERTALSAVYFSMDDIPPTPSEIIAISDLTPDVVAHHTKVIPMKDVEGRVSVVTRYVSQPPTQRTSLATPASGGRVKSPPPALSKVSPPAVNTDILSSLLTNPSALHDILKNVVPSPRATTPPAQFSNPSSSVFPPHNPAVLVSTSPSPGLASLSRGISTQIPVHLPPGMPPMFPPPLPGMPPLPFGMPPLPMGFAAGTFVPPPSMTSGRPARSLCKFYKKGKPNSCRFGSSCQFLHSEY